MSQAGYLLLSTVAFFLTGAALYAADKKITVALRELLHGWTSPENEPFPDSKRKGLVYGQRAQQRFAVAGAVSLIQTLLSIKNLAYNPLLELVTLLIEAPVMVLGTYLGDRVLRLFGRAQPVFEAIDRIDAGESSAKDEARELFQDLAGRDRAAEAAKDPGDTAARAEPVAEASEQPPQTDSDEGRRPEEIEPDPRELMRKYTGE